MQASRTTSELYQMRQALGFIIAALLWAAIVPDSHAQQPGPGVGRPGGGPARPGQGNMPSRPNRPPSHRPGGGWVRPQPLPPSYRRHLPRRHYRLGAYQRPNGYYFRQWATGAILPGLFRAQNYWLTNYGAYGLRPPPPGTVWVRVDNDALLVSNSTGQIIDIIYNVFY